jgi:succinate dehydrogenase / fumarate reductase cytochrome b subunit
MTSIAKRYICSSIGKKQVMAITGFLLILFLLAHLLGNFLFLLGADAFNTYGHMMINNPLLIPMELGLLAIFISHLTLAIWTTIENKAARPTPYYFKTTRGGGSNFASSTMPYTGLVILIFIIAHLIHFKYGAYYTTNVNGVEMRDLYKVVVEYFQNKIWVLWYLFAMISTGIHVAHGFQSVFQSLGINHPRFTPWIKKISCAVGIFIGVGFSALAIYAHLKGV